MSHWEEPVYPADFWERVDDWQHRFAAKHPRARDAFWDRLWSPLCDWVDRRMFR